MPVIIVSESVFVVEVERPTSAVPAAVVESVTVGAGTVVVVAPDRIVDVARTVVSAAAATAAAKKIGIVRCILLLFSAVRVLVNGLRYVYR